MCWDRSLVRIVTNGVKFHTWPIFSFVFIINLQFHGRRKCLHLLDINTSGHKVALAVVFSRPIVELPRLREQVLKTSCVENTTKHVLETSCVENTTKPVLESSCLYNEKGNWTRTRSALKNELMRIRDNFIGIMDTNTDFVLCQFQKFWVSILKLVNSFSNFGSLSTGQHIQ